MFWLSIALARPAIPGQPAGDRCDAGALQAAGEVADFQGFGEAVLAACPGLPPEAGEWVRARLQGQRSSRPAVACSRARGDLKRALSPGFSARMRGVAKSCKIRGWKPESAVGPGALILGWTVSERLIDGGIPDKLAAQIGRRLAGIEGGRLPGRYGSIAAEADSVVLPESQRIRIPLPPVDEAEVWIVDGRSRAAKIEAEQGAWLALLPPEGALEEEAPVYGLLFDPFDAPASLRIAVSSTEVRLAYGFAGAQLEARGADALHAIEAARESLLNAQEFGGGDAPPDRVWIQPVGDVTVSRVVELVDLLHHEDGTPRFDSMTLALEGELVEWPERVDAAGM